MWLEAKKTNEPGTPAAHLFLLATPESFWDGKSQRGWQQFSPPVSPPPWPLLANPLAPAAGVRTPPFSAARSGRPSCGALRPQQECPAAAADEPSPPEVGVRDRASFSPADFYGLGLACVRAAVAFRSAVFPPPVGQPTLAAQRRGAGGNGSAAARMSVSRCCRGGGDGAKPERPLQGRAWKGKAPGRG